MAHFLFLIADTEATDICAGAIASFPVALVGLPFSIGTSRLVLTATAWAAAVASVDELGQSFISLGKSPVNLMDVITVLSHQLNGVLGEISKSTGGTIHHRGFS